MIKRYRAPTVVDGQIKVQRGKLDGDVDICIYFGAGAPRCDRALVLNTLCYERQYTDISTLQTRFDPPLLDELESRGYDLDTLRFSIEQKEEQQND